jgi:hypothetical protein
MVDHGRLLHMGFKPNKELRVEAVNDFVGCMKYMLDEARAALVKAKDDIAQYYNHHRSPAPKYTPGDHVYLDSSDLKTTRPSQKFVHRFVGPYIVERKVGPYVYRLRLPRLMSHLHPVFNVIKLKTVLDDPIIGHCNVPPPELVLIDGEQEYEVEQVLVRGTPIPTFPKPPTLPPVFQRLLPSPTLSDNHQIHR